MTLFLLFAASAVRGSEKIYSAGVEKAQENLKINQNQELVEIVVSMMVDRLALLTRLEYSGERLSAWIEEKEEDLVTAETAVIAHDKSLEDCAGEMTKYVEHFSN